MILTLPNVDYRLNSEDNHCHVLVIEDPVEFRNWIVELQGQIAGNSGKFILSQDSKVLTISKNIDLVINPIELDLNNRKIISKVYDNLEKQSVSEDFYERTRLIEQMLLSYMADLNLSYDEPLTYDLEINMANLFKALDVSYDMTVSLPDRIDQYMKTSAAMLGIKWFFFANLKSYLSQEELEEIYKSAKYNKFNITIFENHVCDVKSPNEKVFVLDKDHCEIW